MVQDSALIDTLQVELAIYVGSSEVYINDNSKIQVRGSLALVEVPSVYVDDITVGRFAPPHKWAR